MIKPTLNRFCLCLCCTLVVQGLFFARLMAINLVSALFTLHSDILLLFPKDYLKQKGMDRSGYNQIANYVYMQSEINIKVGNKPPKSYFELILAQIQENNRLLTGIATEEELQANLRANCIPAEAMQMTYENYPAFLESRRRLMAEKMRGYYLGL